MGILEERLQGKSLADYTNTQLRLALGAVLYTNTADMWKKYLNQLGYTGDVAQMLQKYYVDYNIPTIFRNYVNAGAGIYSPQQLFQDGSIGVLYDNNDLTSFYLDAAGTTPATVNGLVGLQLDKSAGLALGAEIRSSGAIGLVGTATAATYNTSTGVGTATRVDLGNQSFVQFGSLSSWVQLTIQNTGSNAITVRSGSQTGANWVILLGGQSTTAYILPSSSLVTITAADNATTASFTITSIKQLPGNHRYQTTTGSKPILRGTPTGGNLVTNGDFSNGTTGWTGINSATISNVSGALRATYVSANPGIRPAGLTAVIGKVYRLTYTIVAFSGGGTVQPYIGGGGGKPRTVAGTYVDYITAISATGVDIVAFDNTGYVDYDNIEIVDVSAGSVTAPYGLQYDGVDDFLQTASVNFTATDKMFVCAGVRKLSDAAIGMLAELSATWNSNNGSFIIAAPSGAVSDYQFGSRGTVQNVVTRSGFSSPHTAVLTMRANIAGPTLDTKVNIAASTTSTSSQGTGNYGNYPLYFGRRGGTSLPFNGLDFGFVIVGKTLTAAQISSTERWMGQRTGVSI